MKRLKPARRPVRDRSGVGLPLEPAVNEFIEFDVDPDWWSAFGQQVAEDVNIASEPRRAETSGGTGRPSGAVTHL